METQTPVLRQELKFAINYPEYAGLRSVLRTLIPLDRHAGPAGEYHVRSLYFDNDDDDAYFEKESGTFRRAKYRIRIYNRSDTVIRLELKEKYGRSSSKTSRVISRETCEAIMSGRLRFADARDDPFLTAFYLKTQLEHLRPRAIVDYVREPFICASGNVRITFDKELKTAVCGTDIFSDRLLLATPPGFGGMILEVKYDGLLPAYIQNRLNLARHQQLALSKYTICRAARCALSWKERLP